MGRATAVLGLERGRVLALAVGAGILALYGALAERLWELPSRVDLAIVAVLVLSAYLAVLWLALPLARTRQPLVLLGVGAIAAVAWLALHLIGIGSVANVLKFAAFTLLGLWFISLFEELWWVVLVAALVPWVDVWSVEAGPTRYVVEEKPGVFDSVSVAFAVPGEAGTVNLGPPDVIFFALFLAAAARFGLRVAWTWIAMTAFLALTLVFVWETDVSGLPALPAICLGFLVPNADLVSRHITAAWRTRQKATEPD